jgi:hypothetical protein
VLVRAPRFAHRRQDHGGIDAAIRSRDKLLLVLSEHAIKSDWVEDEVKAATS